MNFHLNTRNLFPYLNITFFYNNSVRKFSFPIARGNWLVNNNSNMFSARIINSSNYFSDYQSINNIHRKDDLEEIFFYSDSFSYPFKMSLRLDKRYKHQPFRMYKEIDSNTDAVTLLKLY